jgi:hypothetical protein
MSKPELNPRTSEAAIRKYCAGFKGWDRAQFYLVASKLLFSDNPRKVSRELAEYDRANPDEHLRLKI